ncbi:MAG TPA: segregation/condensation protein A [Patescibacteria group bacterium]|nr:segregation/condensation protein A [Patescibacteria group bacterium]
MYQVKLEKFEGPMELLLQLIEREEMKITELSLANVTDQYLEHIKSSENINLANLADFLSVAARLILIKSRALVPVFNISPQEEEEIRDLAHQLEEFKKFKDAAITIGRLASFKKISYAKEGFWGIKPIFYPPTKINSYDLKKAYIAVLSQIPVIEKLEEEMVAEVITLEEKIAALENSLRLRLESSFAEFVGSASDKIEVIVSFLAVLEMVKQRIIDVEQGELFQEIKLKIKTSQ